MHKDKPWKAQMDADSRGCLIFLDNRASSCRYSALGMKSIAALHAGGFLKERLAVGKTLGAFAGERESGT